jgi:hypothetical protein
MGSLDCNVSRRRDDPAGHLYIDAHRRDDDWRCDRRRDASAALILMISIVEVTQRVISSSMHIGATMIDSVRRPLRGRPDD